MLVKQMLLKVCQVGKNNPDPDLRSSFEYWERIIMQHSSPLERAMPAMEDTADEFEPERE